MTSTITQGVPCPGTSKDGSMLTGAVSGKVSLKK